MIVAEGEVTHAVEAGLEAEVVEGKISDFLFSWLTTLQLGLYYSLDI